MRRFRPLVCVAAFLYLILPACATALAELVPALKEGGYVLVVRHAATDESQKDVYPFVFDDMRKQRQLSDEGRQMARDVGAAIKALSIPLDQVYTSKLNRAVETGALMSGKQVVTLIELTDSSAGRSSAMANPSGSNAKIGSAIQELVNKVPKAGNNNLIVTHKTNIADAFGKEFGNVRDGEALIFKPNNSGPPILVGRVQPREWGGHRGVLKP